MLNSRTVKKYIKKWKRNFRFSLINVCARNETRNEWEYFDSLKSKFQSKNKKIMRANEMNYAFKCS